MGASFDLRTAYFLMGVMGVTASLGLHAALRVEARRGTGLWVFGGIVFGMSGLVLGLRGYIPDVLSFQGNHASLATGFLFQAAAIAHETGRRPRVPVLVGIVAVSTVIYTVLRSIQPVYGLTYTVAMCAFGAIAIVLAALALWRRRRQAGAAFIALGFACLLAGTVFRSLYLEGSWARGGPMETGIHQMALVMGGFMAVILGHIGYLGLQFDHISSARVASESRAATEAERASQTALREAALHELLDERNEMIQRLARSEAANDLAHFATKLPHELSQPLCASQLILESLADRLTRPESQEDLRLVGLIQTNNDRVQKLLQQLRILLRSQQETGWGTVDLRVLVEQTFPIMEASFRDQGHKVATLLPDNPVEVRGSLTQLQQLFLILCINVLDAMRHSGKSSTASGCAVGVRTDAATQATCLFVEGHPADQPSGSSERAGIGLTIARRIAVEHNGQLEAVGLAGFRLWLPAAPPR